MNGAFGPRFFYAFPSGQHAYTVHGLLAALA